MIAEATGSAGMTTEGEIVAKRLPRDYLYQPERREMPTWEFPI